MNKLFGFPHVKTSTLQREGLTASTCVSILLVLFLVLSASYARVQLASAAGTLTVSIIAAPNLVVDSNALSTSTYAPKVATVIGKFCNTGDTAVNNVTAYIGDYTGAGVQSGTPGLYPASTNPTFGSLTYRGVYSFTHLGGAADAARSLGTLNPGDCRYQYWSFEYPHYAIDNSDGSTIATWGKSVKPDDDLKLNFDMWVTGDGGLANNATHTATMRNEISAMANKIKPNGNPSGQWFNTDTSTVYPGQTIKTNGVNYRLGNINQGFDNDGNGTPDYNAWLQPFGDPAYDPSCFRLVGVTGVLSVTRSAGNPDLFIPIDNNLYFTDLPQDNTNVVGLVYYEFLALGGACTIPISPYQEVASGSDNEKFNGDYGTGVPSLKTYAPQVDITKSAPGVQAENTTFTYQIPFQNNSTTSKAGLFLTSGGPISGGLMISDSVPVGLQYVANSASNNNTIPSGNSVSVRFSTNGGLTWSTTDPGTVASTAANRVVIQWWLNQPLDVSGSGNNAGTARYQATIPATYISGGGDPFIENCAAGSFGDAAQFDRARATTVVPGTNSIGDKVWNDANTNGIDDSEPGLPGVTLRLYWDKDGNGALDTTDPVISTTTTNASGIYSFPNLPDARYVVVVDSTTAPAGYRPTSPVSGQIAVNLISAGDINNTTTDFGLGPALSLTKTSLESVPTASNGTLTYKIELENQMPGSGSSQRACRYTVWSSTQDVTNSGSGQQAWQNISNIFGSPNTTYATDPLAAASEKLAVSGFSIGNPGQVINKVELLLPLQVRGTAAGTFQVTLNAYGTGTVQKDFGVEQINTFSNGARVYTVWQTGDVGASAVFSAWTAYTGNAYSVVMEGKKTGDATDLDVDAVGFRITTNGTCGDNSTDITTLPLTDTFNSTVLDFVSASVNPDSTTPAGTLVWNNLGTLYAGGTRELYVTFRVKANSTVTVTNIVTSTGAKFGDGKPTNSPVTDTEPIKGVVGDRVWFDIDADGVQDADESGIPGATVLLCSQASCGTGGGNVIYATATTDANGNYLFSGLTFGTTYYVRVDAVPTGYTGVSDRDGNPFSNVHAFTPSATNVVDLSYDFGYDTSTANRGGMNGYLWNDIDADGVMDPGEMGFSGVTVQLCTGIPPACTSQGTTTTDASGFYQFCNLAAAANYYVRVATPPSGTTRTYEYKALCGTCDGDTINFGVAANAITSNINLGYRRVGTSTIGDLIFRDWNGNATQDGGEEGLSGLTVKLYLDNDNDGVVDSTDYLSATTTTNASGYYSFTNVPAGNYLVVVMPPSNHVQTKDPDESGVCAVCDSQSRQAGVDGTSSYLDHDYAYKPSGASSIGDRVWKDVNGDGVQDATEVGIPNITVYLYEDTTNSGTYDAGVDALVMTTTTDAQGLYIFPGLAAGKYLAVVDSNDPDLPSQSGQPYRTSTSTTVAVDLPVNTAYTSADYGFAPRSSIGDLVWQDNNGNGLWESGEPGINGVVVELYLDANNDDVADGGPIATTTTANNSLGAAGYYLFGGLSANNYIVVVTTTNFNRFIGNCRENGHIWRSSQANRR